MPIRSSFGYHIIKVNSKTPASGYIRAAHIFLAVDPKDPEKVDSLVKIKAQNIYNEVVNDDKNWTDYVRRYSDDKGTLANNGVLSPFRVNQIVPEFITVVKSLEPNQISEPVKTSFGYHIIKLVGSTAPGRNYAAQVAIVKEMTGRNRAAQLEIVKQMSRQ